MPKTETYSMYPQGSDEWLELRRTKVTATDASAILGINPWKSAHDVYLDKMGQGKPFITNPAIERGRMMEDSIREHYEALVNEWFPPAVAIHPDEWALASLDGINAHNTKILEIKTCGKKVFEEVGQGGPPSYYFSQVQFQMMCVPSAKSCAMVFWCDGEYQYIDVPRDEEYIAMLESECKAFYDLCIVGKEPPPLSEKDSIDLSDNPNSAILAAEINAIYPSYQKAKKEYEEVKKRLDKLKMQFIDTSDDGNCHCNNVYVTKSWRKGSVDTEKMIRDGINVEKYRNSPTPSTRLTVK